jgi:hypothetical protein
MQYHSVRIGVSADRHWSPESETYTTADVLLQYLCLGWKLDDKVSAETYYHAGYRRSDVYYFTLKQNGVTLQMPVLANPVVRRIVRDHGLTVLWINAEPLGFLA